MSRNSAKPDPAMEKEANAFAMALLMPADWIRSDVDRIVSEDGGLDEAHIADLAKRYAVSPARMVMRLCELKILEVHT